LKIRTYQPKNIENAIKIWNNIVDEGTAFPQEELLTPTKRIFVHILSNYKSGGFV